MSELNQIFRNLLGFDYILLHRRLYLQLTGYTFKNLFWKTLKTRDTDLSLCEQLVILT